MWKSGVRMGRLSGLLSRFGRDRSGGVAFAFGLSIIMLTVATGLAIDGSRAYYVSARIRAVLDSAAFAGARMLADSSVSDSEIQQKALDYFNAHTASIDIPGTSFTNFTATPNRTTSTVSAQVDVRIPNLFGPIVGVTNYTFTPSSQVSFVTRSVEIALVLDISGSMCEPNPQPCSNAPKLDALRAAVNSMISELLATSPDAGAIRLSIVPYSSAVNVGFYEGTVAHSPNAADDCVVERDGNDIYGDSPPTGGYQFDSVLPGSDPWYICPLSPIVPLKDISVAAERSQLETAVANLQGFGGTGGHIGTAWGWYTISPRWNWVWPVESRPRPYGPNAIKAVVIMTDGSFNYAFRNGGEGLMPPLSEDRFRNGTSPYQALQLCSNMRGQDVEVYTVGFQSPPQSAAFLEECAGSPANYYDADNSGQLISAFKAIANKLTSIRLTQ